MIRVLIVDDQALVREGFRMILELDDEIEVVGEAQNGQTAIDAVERTQPDLVLMDIRMPGVDGLEATRRVLRRESPPRVLILTTYDADENVFHALRAGASGFLLKDVRKGQLVRAVHQASAGDTVIDPSITARLIERFMDRMDPAPEARAALRHLSQRETEVLTLIAKGLSNAELAARLHVSESTIKTHVARILAKLELRDRVQLVIFAYETGIAGPWADTR